MRPDARPLEQATTKTSDREKVDTLDPRVPGLTLLWHPDPDRVGENRPLPGLASGQTVPLSRLEPTFAGPSGAPPHPLGLLELSRTPVLLGPASEPGALYLERSGSKTTVEVAGRPAADSYTFSDAEIERGVALLLGRSVALLLHRLVPGAPRDDGDFGLVGRAATLRRLRDEIRTMAPLDMPILIRGETGTGKELVARALHEAGSRRGHPFLAVNMATLPPPLAAAELFGAVRGAFTGLDRNRDGLFRAAHGGTLFLDEIGEAPTEVQALLLRALETGEIRPVGGVESQRVDVRVLAATDADLESSIEGQQFRAPLLHRLAGYTLRVPPLRDRREDFGLLLVHLLRRAEAELGGPRSGGGSFDRSISAELVAQLTIRSWPGNVRQLGNAARRLMIAHRSGGPPPSAAELLTEPEADQLTGATSNSPASAASARNVHAVPRGRFRKPAEVSDEELREALRSHGWEPARAAEALRVSRATMFRLIDRAPGLRKAKDLEPKEIESALAEAEGRIEHAAALLEVSAQGLKRRWTELKRRREEK